MLILGICSGHDAAAALIQDGKVVAAASEERFTRIKNYNGEPIESTKALLHITSVHPKNIDYVMLSKVCYGRGEMTLSPSSRRLRMMSQLSDIGAARILFGTQFGVELLRVLMSKRLHPVRTRKQYVYLRELGIRAPLIPIDHHLSHLASAYYTSGWSRCLAVSLDAIGDGYCARVALCDNGRIRIVKSIPAYHSPAFYYSYVTKLLGFKEGRHEGKITGLAAYGNPLDTAAIFRERINYVGSKRTFVNRGQFLFSEMQILERKLKGRKPEDIAAGIQYHLEDMTVSFVKHILHQTGMRRLVLAGGVFANVKLNQRIREIEGVDDIWVHPEMGDGGGATGSALFHWFRIMQRMGKSPQPEPMEHVFLGPGFSDEVVEDELKRCRLHY